VDSAKLVVSATGEYRRRDMRMLASTDPGQRYAVLYLLQWHPGCSRGWWRLAGLSTWYRPCFPHLGPSRRCSGGRPGTGRPGRRQEEPGPAGLVEGMSADDVMPSAAQVRAAAGGRATHPREPHTGGTAGRLNWLRAAVLGANDGIVSVAGIVIGVAGGHFCPRPHLHRRAGRAGRRGRVDGAYPWEFAEARLGIAAQDDFYLIIRFTARPAACDGDRKVVPGLAVPVGDGPSPSSGIS
jgi:hypothetical protein